MDNNLFPDVPDQAWKEHWKGMPEYNVNNLRPIRQLIISFSSQEDVKKFAELIGQSITPKTKSLWYPEVEIDTVKNIRYTND